MTAAFGIFEPKLVDAQLSLRSNGHAEVYIETSAGVMDLLTAGSLAASSNISTKSSYEPAKDHVDFSVSYIEDAPARRGRPRASLPADALYGVTSGQLSRDIKTVNTLTIVNLN